MKYTYKVSSNWEPVFFSSGNIPLVTFRDPKVTKLSNLKRVKKIKKEKIIPENYDCPKPEDYEYCPHCKGSFSFAKLNKTFKCPWCKKDVRKTSIIL